MKAHDLAKVLLSMENVEVAFQYWDGGNDSYNEPLVDSITEYQGIIYLTNGDLCKHNGVDNSNIDEICCYVEEPFRYDHTYICSVYDNIVERINYLNSTEDAVAFGLGQFDDYMNVYFTNQESLDKFINMFK